MKKKERKKAFFAIFQKDKKNARRFSNAPILSVHLGRKKKKGEGLYPPGKDGRGSGMCNAQSQQQKNGGIDHTITPKRGGRESSLTVSGQKGKIRNAIREGIKKKDPWGHIPGQKKNGAQPPYAGDDPGSLKEQGGEKRGKEKGVTNV